MTRWILGAMGILVGLVLFVERSEQRPPLLDRGLFLGSPSFGQASVSPQGDRVAYLRSVDGVLNLWVGAVEAPIADGWAVTTERARPISEYHWSADGRSILVVQDPGGSEGYHIHRFDLDESGRGAAAGVDLTPGTGLRARVLATPYETPDRITIALNDRDASVSDVYSLDISTGERTLLVRNNWGIAQWVPESTGAVRFGVRVRPDGGTEVLRIDGDVPSTVYACGNTETCPPVGTHPDGVGLFVASNKGQRDRTALILVDTETGTSTTIEDDPEGRVDLAGASFDPLTGALSATFYVDERIRAYPKTEAFAKNLRFLRATLPDGDLRLGSRSNDGAVQVVTLSSDVDPGSTYVLDRRAGTVRLLFHTRPDMPIEDLAPMTSIRYRARDGLEIQAFLTLPTGIDPQALPLVVYPHGGPWERDQWGYSSYVQFLVNRGYAVLQPNFRGSIGFGKAFLNAGNQELGSGSIQHDITDGVEFLINQGVVDRERVGIFGVSFGGYAALSGLAFTPDLYAAGISNAGPTSLLTVLEQVPPFLHPLLELFHTRVGDPSNEVDRERLIAQSPLYSADRIQAPVVIIQGANDPRVPQSEADQMVSAIRAAGGDVTYLLAANEGHGYREPINRLTVAATVERFFAQHLGGRYQADLSPELADRLHQLTVTVREEL